MHVTALQREDFVGILESLDGLPVTIRLIDPALPEFVPDYTEPAVEVCAARRAGHVNTREHRLLEAVKPLHEQNPMLGLRDVSLGMVIAGPFTRQARAILAGLGVRVFTP